MSIYQETAAVFEKRKEIFEQRGGQFSDKLGSYDVQVCFAYLQIIFELNKRAFLAKPVGLEEAVLFLKTSLDMNPDRVGSALGNKGNAEIVLNQIQKLDEFKIAEIWNGIKNLENSKRSYYLLKNLHDFYLSLPSQELRKKSLSNIRLEEHLIISAIAKELNIFLGEDLLSKNEIND